MKNKNSISIDKVLSEIYRRLNYFHGGDVNTELLLLSLPSEAKPLKELGIIVHHNGREVPKTLNWYKLTNFGKEYFSEYVTKHKLSDETNSKIFSQKYIKRFKPINIR